MLSVIISVADRDSAINLCYRRIARFSCTNQHAGVIVVDVVVIIYVVIDVAVDDFKIVTDLADDGRVRVIRSIEVIMAVLASIVIDGGIGNTGLKRRGAARMRGTYRRSRVLLAQEVAFAGLALN